MVKVKADTKQMDELIKVLNEDYILRIGILGSKAKAKHGDSNLTNAELGTFHEFGTSRMARRSFLEDSLNEKLQFNTEDMKNIRKSVWKNVFVKKKPREFLKDLGAKALDVIESAFATNGFGKWKPWTPAYERRRVNAIKGKRKREQFWLNHNILTATGKLRRSMSFKVIKK